MRLFSNQVLQYERFFWPVVLVFLMLILAPLLFWEVLPAQFRTNDSSDYTRFYEPVARNVLAGRGLTHTDGTPAIRYPPGHPLLLAGIFGLSSLLNIPEGIVLSAYTLLCMSLTSLVVFLLARSVWGSFPALISLLVWMTYPFALWLTKQQSSEIPFLVVFYGGFYLFWYALLCESHIWPLYFLSGLFIGLAMLIRPIAIGVGIVLGIVLWLVGTRMTARFRLFLTAMLLLGNLVAILPWEAWVYSITGRVVMLSTGGVASMRDGLLFAAGSRQRHADKFPQDVVALMQDILAYYDKSKSIRGIISIMTEKLQTQPLPVAKLLGLKVVRSWYGTDSQRYETPIMFIQVVYLILVLWGSVAAWKRGGTTKKLTISIWLMVLYFWGMTIFALSILRYMVPVMGLLFTLVPGLFFKLRT